MLQLTGVPLPTPQHWILSLYPLLNFKKYQKVSFAPLRVGQAHNPSPGAAGFGHQRHFWENSSWIFLLSPRMFPNPGILLLAQPWSHSVTSGVTQPLSKCHQQGHLDKQDSICFSKELVSLCLLKPPT